jgi:hypothetical protein
VKKRVKGKRSQIVGPWEDFRLNTGLALSNLQFLKCIFDFKRTRGLVCSAVLRRHHREIKGKCSREMS